jgi:hypothetical protein
MLLLKIPAKDMLISCYGLEGCRVAASGAEYMIGSPAWRVRENFCRLANQCSPGKI